MRFRLRLNPITRKRLQRFKEMRRAYIAFWLLIGLYGLSLVSELVCSNVPLWVRFDGETYLPKLRYYPSDVFTGSGRQTRPDYKKIAASPAFCRDPENFMVFPPVPFGPNEIVDPADISVSSDVTLVFQVQPQVGAVYVDSGLRIVRAAGVETFFDGPEAAVSGSVLRDRLPLAPAVETAAARRFSGRPAPRFQTEMTLADGRRLQVEMPGTPGGTVPAYVRVTFREVGEQGREPWKIVLNPDRPPAVQALPSIWSRLKAADRRTLQQHAEWRRNGPVDAVTVDIGPRRYRVDFVKQDVRFPFPPTRGHWMGIDSAGRDVLARILYGLRISVTFGLLLVACSMCLGILAGAVQGYFGGWFDITAQRGIEIWSALPFLYVMILMGSIYGRSFWLLLVCYGLFNWIGISYYIRAEFLRLRRRAFVETARCMGLSDGVVIVRHILPNSLVPVVTFFPFSLVGAIGALAALDYLGFGLPPPTPSWGELLFQAQQHRWAWWLILYPSVALFMVMLLGVFVGEGIRHAYDPKRSFRLV